MLNNAEIPNLVQLDVKSTISMLQKRQTPNFWVEKHFPITGGPEMSSGGQPGGN